MVEPSEIEKKSLEAHVELCAERYTALHGTITKLETSVADVCTMIREVKESVVKMAEKNNDRLIKIGRAHV